jgi:diguanylate cyclase (GGDEF)-like protein/PAS domain S-box-containing protein
MYNLFNYPMALSRYNRPHEQYLQTVIAYHNDGILLVNQEGQVLFANASAASLLGLSEEALYTQAFPYLLNGDVNTILERKNPGRQPLTLEMTVQSAVCQDLPVYLVTLKDVTPRIQHEQKLRLAAQAFETTPEGIFITDEKGRIILANRAFTDITGYTSQEVLGKDAHQFHADQRDDEFYRQMWKSLAIISQWQGEIWNRRKEGEIYPEWVTISTVKDSEGRLLNYIVIFTDISSRKSAEERLRFLATHDPLTNLPNRELFYDRLSQALMRARRAKADKGDKWRVAVMLMDLDNFKTINDTLGHAWGDRVLMEVAQRLEQCVRKSDSVARLGGDEFTVVLEGLASKENCVLVATKILQAISQPFDLEGHVFIISASIGISVYPADGDDGETLFKHADVAMYRAKQKRGCFEFYE